jgi:esterase/lipase superfamily enzyme
MAELIYGYGDGTLNPHLCHEIEMLKFTNSGTIMGCASLLEALKINFYQLKKITSPFFYAIRIF